MKLSSARRCLCRLVTSGTPVKAQAQRCVHLDTGVPFCSFCLLVTDWPGLAWLIEKLFLRTESAVLRKRAAAVSASSNEMSGSKQWLLQPVYKIRVGLQTCSFM